MTSQVSVTLDSPSLSLLLVKTEEMSLFVSHEHSLSTLQESSSVSVYILSICSSSPTSSEPEKRYHINWRVHIHIFRCYFSAFFQEKRKIIIIMRHKQMSLILMRGIVHFCTSGSSTDQV